MAEKPTKKRKRSTKSELSLRTDTIYGMLCEGKSRANIILFTSEVWDVTERQTDNYIAEARKKLELDCAMTREAFMAEALAGYREIRDASFRRGQLMCSKQALDAMVQLVGLTGKN